MKILFISDFYINEIIGGAEICNNVLINKLKNCYNITCEKSHNVKIQDIEKYDFFIIANFFQLNDEIKNYLSLNKQKKYVIYEHDHKYVLNNNPSIFPNFVIDENYLINKNFYSNSIATLAQSKIHSEIIQKNLLLENVINLGGNLWDDNSLSILSKYRNTTKTIKFGILKSTNKNKGMLQAIEYCNKKNINFELIEFQEYEEFINNLSKVENLIFFPQWLETFSRVSLESKVLGCKLITNKLIGAASEEYLHQNSDKVIETIKDKNIEIINIFKNLINNNLSEITFVKKQKLPKVSIITSMYKAGQFIEHFLTDITRQSIFDECELILLDANSPDNESEIIEHYCKKYKNIKYFKFHNRLNVHQTLNEGIRLSEGEYVTIANVDDRRRIDCLEILRKHLFLNEKVDLVYGDCLVTDIKNENFENCKSHILYEHSVNHFTKENMIKCLPGPIPMWKKKMSLINGIFNEELKFAGDWEFWLRCVKNGSIFKKVDCIVGTYYNNPQGISTNQQNYNNKFSEERKIFIDYKDVFGYSNYEKFRNYFNV